MTYRAFIRKVEIPGKVAFDKEEQLKLLLKCSE